MKIEIKSRFDSSKILLCGEYESIKDCLEKNRGAYLGGAYLGGADLRGADLGGAKEYYNSHAFFAEIIRRQKVETFTPKEWCAIGQIVIHTLCWDSIHKRFEKEAMGIFKKLSKAGFDEFLKKFTSQAEV